MAYAYSPSPRGLPLSESHLDAGARLGVALAARTPLSKADELWLTNPALKAWVKGAQWTLHDKGMVGCTIEEIGGKRIRVYSLHLFPVLSWSPRSATGWSVPTFSDHHLAIARVEL